MSKKQREKVEDEVRYHRAVQQRAQQVEIPDTTITSYNEGHQTPSSTDPHIFPNTPGYPYSNSVEGGVYSPSTYSVYSHQQIQDPYISTDTYPVDSTTCYDLPRSSLSDNMHTVDTSGIIGNTIATGGGKCVSPQHHAPLAPRVAVGAVKLEAETGGGEPASPLVTFVDSTTSRQMEETPLPRKADNFMTLMYGRKFIILD